MYDTKEVVLFFNKEVNFESFDVAKEITKRFPQIGDAIILPNSKNLRQPVILFSSSEVIKIQISKISVNILVNHTLFDELTSGVFDLIDLFEGFDCSFNRIGYIASFLISPRDKEILENKYLKMEKLKDVTDYSMSFYHEIKTKENNLNAWERITYDSANLKDVLYQFDINSKENDQITFDMKYLKRFFKDANNFIDKKVNFSD